MAIDYGVVTDEFENHLKAKEYKEALVLYYYANKPFWLTERVADSYMRIGMVGAAMEEFEFLVNEYLNISPDFLPLPQGPEELFTLARWYMNKDKTKARRYLKIYLSAEDRWKTDPAFYVRHKNAAKRLLYKLTG